MINSSNSLNKGINSKMNKEAEAVEEAVDLVIVEIDQEVAVAVVEASEEKVVVVANADKVEVAEAEARIKLSGCL